MRSKIAVDYFPKDILFALNGSESDLEKRIKVTLSIQLYTLQKLTIGKVAQLSHERDKRANWGNLA